jgi:hypothetical protein
MCLGHHRSIKVFINLFVSGICTSKQLMKAVYLENEINKEGKANVFRQWFMRILHV